MTANVLWRGFEKEKVRKQIMSLEQMAKELHVEYGHVSMPSNNQVQVVHACFDSTKCYCFSYNFDRFCRYVILDISFDSHNSMKLIFGCFCLYLQRLLLFFFALRRYKKNKYTPIVCICAAMKSSGKNCERHLSKRSRCYFTVFPKFT